MGLLSGVYDAKTGGGFQAGGMSLHNIMAGHGPDADAHERVTPFCTTFLTVGLQHGIETSKDHGGKYGVHVWYTHLLTTAADVHDRIFVDAGSQ